jgi:P27 family predicted phage terminase small subunit
VGGPGSGGHNRKFKLLHNTLRPGEHPRLWEGESHPRTEQKIPKRHLSAESKRLWENVTSTWVIDNAALVLLRQCCECLDRIREAQKQIARDGLTVVNPKTGALQAHPGIKIESDSRQNFLKFWRALGLDPDEAPGS